MRRLLHRPLLAILAVLLFAGPGAILAQDPASAGPQDQAYDGDPDWPRVVEQGDTTFTIYQPQIDKFDAATLEARAAVQVETKVGDKKQTTYGVLWIKANTAIDKESRLVRLDEIEIVKVNFPTAGDKAEEYLRIFRANVEQGRTVSLDRIEANLAITQADKKGSAVPLKNDPPAIFYRSTPAVLVLIDGDPALRPVEGVPGVERVVNTRGLVLKSGGAYYLPIADKWLTSGAPTGPWQLSSGAPAPVQAIRDAIAKDENQSQVDLMEETSDDVKGVLAEGKSPEIIVSTSPAELISTQGTPQMKPVTGTQLLYVTNTSGDILFDLSSQSYYVPLTGRWFRSKALDGPWQFIDGDKLPKDFAKIPTSDPKSNVLATVPGTPAAQEAVIANSIPQTAEVNREEAKFESSYDGEPKFDSVPDTPLQYAVNSPTPIVRVDPTTYYAVQQGVWFTGASPVGPWIVATSVPPVIYTIPTASPIHYVTYVRIYRSSPTVVWVGYTPGYLGTCYSPWGTVVYGTGWYYRPWIGNDWYGSPWTWGFGAGISWNPWFGWGFGFGWGGYRPYYNPWWGPYYGYRRPPYRPPPGQPVPYGRPGYRPPMNNWNNMNVYKRPGGQPRPGVRPAVQPSTRPGTTRPGTAPGTTNPSTRPAPGTTNPSTRPAPGTTNPSTRPAPGTTNPSTRPAPGGPTTRPTKPDNVYAGPDGNVYRPQPGKPGNWETNDGGKWKPVQPSQPSTRPSTQPSTRPSAPPSRPSQPSTRPAPQPRPSVDPGTMNQLSRDYQGRKAGDTRMSPPPQQSRPAPQSRPPQQSRQPAPQPKKPN